MPINYDTDPFPGRGNPNFLMNLTSIINADLTTMLFYVRNETASRKVNAVPDGGGASINFKHGAWTFGEKLRKIQKY